MTGKRQRELMEQTGALGGNWRHRQPPAGAMTAWRRDQPRQQCSALGPTGAAATRSGRGSTAACCDGEEVGQFLESLKLLTLSPDEAGAQKSPVASEEMDLLTKRLQEKTLQATWFLWRALQRRIKTSFTQSLLEYRCLGETSQFTS